MGTLDLDTSKQGAEQDGAARPMSLAEKQATNTWDNVQDFIKVLQAMRCGQWWWFNNPECKYVELRVDMRDGGCVIKNRHGVRIDPTTLAKQYGDAVVPGQAAVSP